MSEKISLDSSDIKTFYERNSLHNDKSKELNNSHIITSIFFEI